uniref:RNase H type-1 domain-containing protein n=1 Tax=Brassica oleracea var. oleracea TaxID=109376 RepID=A0A0D3CNU4_BRAOL
MVSELDEWPAFESYLEDIKFLRRSFTNSDIVHVPRTENIKADRLAHIARKQPSFVVHMDAELSLWFTEST